MRIPLGRALVGTTVTATALLTVAGTASATTVKTPVQLSIAESATSIAHGQTDVITGALTAGGKGLAKKAVVLEEFYRHRWHPVGARMTNGSGEVAFRRKPVHSASFKLAFRGNATYARALSGTVHVTVRPAKRVMTGLSIAESATSITAGQYDVITGTLTADGKGLPKKAVILEHWLRKRWIPVAARVTTKTGTVKFKTRPWASTSFRLEYHGNSRYARTHSDSVQVTVTKTATALAASESAATIKAGQRDTVDGTLTEAGKPLAKRIVWIYRLVQGKKPQRVQAHLTKADGIVSFAVKPKATTSYELVYFGTRTLASSVSNTVTVTVTP